MKIEKVSNVLKIINAENVTHNDTWFKFSCIFSKHTHYSGKDSNPSAGVTIDVGRSIYNCFSCGKVMPLDSALFDLLMLNKECEIPSPQIVKALDYIASLDDDEIDLSDFDYDDKPITKDTFFEFPEVWLQSFSPVTSSTPALDYLFSRKGGGLPLEVLKDFDIRFDNARQMICFPYREPKKDRVAGMRGRSIDPGVNSDNTKKKFRHYDYSYKDHNNTSLIWYRANKLDTTKPLIVVEGEFDCARVYQQYRNVTALLTANVSEVKKNLLCSFTNGIIWLSDNDKAGVDSRNNARKYFEKQGIKFDDLILPEDFKDPYEMPIKYYKSFLQELVDVDALIE